MTTMMEYTTVDAVRSRYLSSDSNVRDEILLDLIRSTSREIEAICNRRFYPRIAARTYDTPSRDRRYITLDDDLLELSSATNGDDTAWSASDYKLYPLNESVKSEFHLLHSATQPFIASSAGDMEGAISLAGTWGYTRDYPSAWAVTAATITTTITTPQPTAAVTPSIVNAGELLRFGGEYVYAASVTTSTAADTLALTRGVNGSTAATHAAGEEVERWVTEEVEMICRVAVAAYFRLRINPVGESVQIGEASFSTPKDVTHYMTRRLGALGLIRVGIG